MARKYSLLRRLAWRNRYYLAATIVISIVAIGLTLLWNYILGGFITEISAGNGFKESYILPACISALMIAVSQYVFTMMAGWTAETMAHCLRMEYARSMQRRSIMELEAMNAGEQISGLQNELTEISEYLNGGLMDMINNFIKFIFTFSWLVCICPRLAVLANLPVIFLIIYVTASSKVISGLVTKEQQKRKEASGFSDTLLTLFPVIRLYEAGALIKRKYKGEIDECVRLSVREERTKAALMSVSAFLSFAPLTLTLFIGGNMVISGMIPLGTLYMYINLSGNVSGIMMNMPSFIANYRRFTANIRRIEDGMVQ